MKQSTNRDELPLYKQILLGIALSITIASAAPQTYKSLSEILSDRIKPIEISSSYKKNNYVSSSNNYCGNTPEFCREYKK